MKTTIEYQNETVRIDTVNMAGLGEKRAYVTSTHITPRKGNRLPELTESPKTSDVHEALDNHMEHIRIVLEQRSLLRLMET
jgi:hypothetical protein